MAVLPRIVGGSGDAGVGAGACRIEMYLYTLYILGYNMGEDSSRWRGDDKQIAPRCIITTLVPIILFHSRPSLGQRLERTMVEVTVTLVLA